MTLLLGIIYISLLVFPLFKKKKDYFSPIVLFIITMSFYSLPDVISILSGGEASYCALLPFKIKQTPEYAIQRMLFCQILFVICYYAGYSLYFRRKNDFPPHNNPIDATNKKLNLFATIFGMFISLYVTLSFIASIGGIQALLLAFTDRTSLSEEQTFLQQHIPIIMTLCSAFCIKYVSQCKSKPWFLVILFVIASFIVQTSGGGRSGFVVLVLSLICYYNYWVKKVNLFSSKFYPLYLALAVFIIIFQLLRFEDSSELSLSSVTDNSASLFSSMSYVKTQVLIQNYFDNHEFWYGRIYSFLLYMFIPRSICPSKPHIDEGSYFFNMTYQNGDVLMSDDFYNSWPPFTAGISYANGGIIGLIIGGLVLGCIHAYMYKKIKQYNYSVYVLIIYVFVILKFQLTVFYICNVVYLLIEVWLASKLYKYANNIIHSRIKR